MTSENYIVIQGWMVNELKLKGNNLILFALIYGFSQDGETEFKGSNKYLCSAINATKPTVNKSLDKLQEMDLLIKRVERISGVDFNRYRVNLRGVKKLYHPSKETLPDGGKETLPGSKESLPNNTNSNTNRDNLVSTDNIFLIQNRDFLEAFADFKKLRKQKKKPLTEAAEKRSIKKAENLAAQYPREAKAVGGVENYIILLYQQTVDKGWDDVYPLKDDFLQLNNIKTNGNKRQQAAESGGHYTQNTNARGIDSANGATADQYREGL